LRTSHLCLNLHSAKRASITESILINKEPMYSFIFYFIYRAKLNQDGAALTRYSANLVVSIFMTVHLALLYAIVRFILCYYWQISIARHNVIANRSDNLKYIAIFFAINIISFNYFNKRRVDRILSRYEKVEKFYTLSNILAIIFLFLIPLVIAIFLVNRSVRYWF
jgi:hypothetical protein